MSVNFYEEIINNYKKLYETKESYDVKIYAGEKQNIKEFHVHSFVLKTQSEFFKKAFITKDFIFKYILEIVELIYQKKFLNKLWNFCIQEICCTSDCLFESTKFLTLNPAILEIILKRDDFYVDNEIIIWEKLLKWTCGQQPV